MSISSEGQYGRLIVTSPHARISVIDAWLELVPGGTGFGHVDLEVAPGPYQVRATVGGFEQTKTVLVRPRQRRELAVPVAFASAAPVQGALNFDEAHAELTVRESSGFSRHRPDPTLLVVVRGRTRPIDPGDRLQPFRLQAGPHAVREVVPTTLEGSTGFASAWPFVLSPGLCRLEWTFASGHEAEHALWLPAGFKAVVFVPGGETGPDLVSMSIHLIPERRRWDPAGEDELAVEAARAAWRDQSPGPLLRTPSRNPMALLLTQHHRLATGGREALDREAVLLLQAALRPEHPDVRPLLEGLPPSPLPPMFTTSLAAVLPQRPAGVSSEPWELFEEIVAQRYASGPWLTWNGEGVFDETWRVFHLVKAPEAGPLPAAVARMADLLRSRASLEHTTPEQVAAEMSPVEVAHSLGTTREFVERVRDAALELSVRQTATAPDGP